MKSTPLGVGITFHDSDGRQRHIEINNDPLDGFKIRVRRGDESAQTICLTLSEALAVQGGLFDLLGRPKPCNPDEGLREKVDVREWVAAFSAPPNPSACPGEGG
jgi:hypothetical protein